MYRCSLQARRQWRWPSLPHKMSWPVWRCTRHVVCLMDATPLIESCMAVQSVCFVGAMRLRVLQGTVVVQGQLVRPEHGTVVLYSPVTHALLSIVAVDMPSDAFVNVSPTGCGSVVQLEIRWRSSCHLGLRRVLLQGCWVSVKYMLWCCSNASTCRDLMRSGKTCQHWTAYLSLQANLHCRLP